MSYAVISLKKIILGEIGSDCRTPLRNNDPRSVRGLPERELSWTLFRGGRSYRGAKSRAGAPRLIKIGCISALFKTKSISRALFYWSASHAATSPSFGAVIFYTPSVGQGWCEIK